MSKPLLILIDADMFAFQACAAVEEEINWGNDIWTLHADLGDAKAKFIDKLNYAIEQALSALKYKGEYKVVFCLSDKDNFRKQLLPTYKANRIGKRKPVCYRGLVDWIKAEYEVCQKPKLEADDCIGILATMKTNKGNTLIISGDKDMKSIPAHIYNYMSEEFTTIDETTADYWHLYQTLIGDSTDNYSGCPTIGAKTAEKLLAEGATWWIVKTQFEKKKLTEEDALVQARVARILRASDWNFVKKEVILWTPEY